jgi:hypothetical protein
MSKKSISRPGILLFSLSIILFSEVFRFKGILSVPLLRDTEKKRMGGYAFFVLGVFGGARMSVPRGMLALWGTGRAYFTRAQLVPPGWICG